MFQHGRKWGRGFKLSMPFFVVLAVLTACASQKPPSSQDDASLRDTIETGILSLNGRRVTQSTFFDSKTGSKVKLLSFGELPGWQQDRHNEALATFKISCELLLKLRHSRPSNGIIATAQDWRSVCSQAMTTQPAQAQSFFEQNFIPVRIAPDQKATLTAYYEPELPARLRPDGRFRFPIYAKPADLVSGRPYYSRGQIYQGALRGRGLELAYLDDPVELLFLQIQGSGRLRLGDGSMIRVGFAAKNGHGYRSVGRELVRRGWSRSGGKQAITDFVRRNPRRGFELLAHNPSYIFFEKLNTLDPQSGPLGAMTTQLVTMRSIAVDPKFTPLGAPVWIEGNSPIGMLQRLMVAQDTGSAVKGPQRADIFWGIGQYAGSVANQMKQPGVMTVFMPRQAIERFVSRPS